MSGKPSPDGVAVALELLEQMMRNSRTVKRLRTEIATKSLELAKVTEAFYSQERQLNIHMTQMDLTQVGNYGHEERRNWFLIELLNQVHLGSTCEQCGCSVPQGYIRCSSCEGLLYAQHSGNTDIPSGSPDRTGETVQQEPTDPKDQS